MRLTQIRDFVTVVEAGSIRAAARKLGVSQPAITKSVRSLEEELHSRLVQRTPHGVVPTPQGRAFFARARVAHSELHKAEEELTQLDSQSTGSVAFGVGPVVALMVVPEAVTSFRRQFPRARLRIMEGYAHTFLPLVRDETLDFALTLKPDGKLDSALAFRPLFRLDFVVVARKGHPLRNARSLTELPSAEWISLMPPGSPGGPLERAFASAGLPAPQQMIRCDSHHVAVALLAKTDILGIVSTRMLKQPPALNFLQRIAVAEKMPSYTVGLITRLDPPLTPLAAVMAKATTAVARQVARS
jgi:DNA-binding transcriptional LysR family regulator